MSKRRQDTTSINVHSTKEELGKLTVETLKTYCKQNSIVVTGTKDVIISKIRSHLKQESKGSENSHPNVETATTSKPPAKKPRTKVQFSSESNEAHIFDKADPPMSNIYDIFGNGNNSRPQTPVEPKRNKKNEHPILSPGDNLKEMTSVFSLHDVKGDEEVGLETEYMTVKELKEELRIRDLKTTGTRRELLDRLHEALGEVKPAVHVPTWLKWRD